MWCWWWWWVVGGGGGVERHFNVPLWAKTWAEDWSLGQGWTILFYCIFTFSFQSTKEPDISIQIWRLKMANTTVRNVEKQWFGKNKLSPLSLILGQVWDHNSLFFQPNHVGLLTNVQQSANNFIFLSFMFWFEKYCSSLTRCNN